MVLCFQSSVSNVSAEELDVEVFEVSSLNYTGTEGNYDFSLGIRSNSLIVEYSEPEITDIKSLGIIKTSGEDTDSALITYQAEVKTEMEISMSSIFKLSTLLHYTYQEIVNYRWIEIFIYGGSEHDGNYREYFELVNSEIDSIDSSEINGLFSTDIAFNPIQTDLTTETGMILLNEAFIISESESTLQYDEIDSVSDPSVVRYDETFGELDRFEFSEQNELVLGDFLPDAQNLISDMGQTYVQNYEFLEQREYINMIDEISSAEYSRTQTSFEIPINMKPEISTAEGTLTLPKRYISISGDDIWVNNAPKSYDILEKTTLTQVGVKYIIETTNFIELPLQLDGIDYESFINNDAYRNGTIFLDYALSGESVIDPGTLIFPESIEENDISIGISTFSFSIISLIGITIIIIKKRV